MGISGGGSFPMWSVGSLIIIFQLFRCRNLPLNRIFLPFLRSSHIFTLKGHAYTPINLYAPIGLYAPCTFRCPHMFKHPHMSPMLPCVSVCSRGYMPVIWGCKEVLHIFGHPHMFGCLPICPTFPSHLYTPMLPCTSVCSREYLHVIWGYTPYVGGLWGINTSVRLLVSASTSIGCPLCFILYLSCSSLHLKCLLPWL